MTHNNTKNNYGFALLIIGILFFVFGFITWANSQLIPYLKIACQLTDTQSYLVASAFFAAYFVMSLPASALLNKVGFKKGMSLGLAVMAVGALVFIPAAEARSYPLFLTGLFIQGTGLALLQTASNPYVTILGPLESAAQRISIMGICNKVAGILAVYILGNIALKDSDALIERIKTMSIDAKNAELDLLANRVVMPYTIIAVALVVLAALLYFMHLPEVQQVDESDDSKSFKSSDTHSLSANTKKSIFDFPHLILGAIAIFFYVGVEVMSYDTFSTLGKSLGYPLDTAKHFASYTGYGLLVGYLLSIVAIPKWISQRKALIVATILSIIMVVLAATLQGTAAIVAFALLGFTNSVMWPAIWPLSMNGLGRFTKTGAALLTMGIVGGAVLPPLYGLVSSAIGSSQTGYFIMIPCYLFILYFALAGYKIKNKNN